MNAPIELPGHDAALALAEIYRCAAQEMLHAYQCTKEAMRLHERQAFRAALHHASLSCRHSQAAYEHLQSALAHCTQLTLPCALMPTPEGTAQRSLSAQ